MADDIKGFITPQGMNPPQRISVRIGGIYYQLVSAEDERYTRQIAARADEMIRRVMQNNPQLSQNMSAVLSLVNTLDELARVRQQFAAQDEQRQQHDRQISEVRGELARMREQNWEMKKELLRLNNLCHDYEVLLQKAVLPGSKEVDDDSDILIDGGDDTVYQEEVTDSQPAPKTVEEPVEPERTQTLRQTNLDDYLRSNGWPQPIEPREYDI